MIVEVRLQYLLEHTVKSLFNCLWYRYQRRISLQVGHSLLYYGKGKAIPLQAWTGPEGSRRVRLPDFKTIGTLRW